MKLGVFITSTRPNRVGLTVGQWFLERARAHAGVEPTLVDLKELALPHFNEPNHPRQKKYEHEHTRAFSELVTGLDAFVFVTPEYNYGMPPALLNALNYLFVEWNYKAAAFVSYGGISAGLRSVQMSKPVLTTLRMMPLPEGVSIPFIAKELDAEGRYPGSDAANSSAAAMLAELLKWDSALRSLRG